MLSTNLSAQTPVILGDAAFARLKPLNRGLLERAAGGGNGLYLSLGFSLLG